MRPLILSAAALLLMVQQAAAQINQQTEAARIAEARAAFVEAYRGGDVNAIMSAYHTDAAFSGTLAPFWIKGEAAVRDQWERYFAAWPQRRLIFREVETRFFADNVSVETGYLEMYMGQPDTRQFVSTFIRYSITRVREKDAWLIANMNVARLPGN